MRGGKLDSTIVLQRSTHTVDPAGTPTFEWTDIATVRAEIVQSGTEEFLRAYGASDENLTLFRMRYVDGITNADRILFGGAVFNLRKVTEIRRRRGLEILAISTGAT